MPTPCCFSMSKRSGVSVQALGMKADDFRIEFFVIGAQKCATSWLHLCLAEHPQLRLPRKKREKTYIGGKVFKEKGIEWFMSRYPPIRGVQKTGDVSVEYLYDPEAAEAVKAFAPGANFVAVLRNPIDRLVSAYHWLVRKRLLPDVPIEDSVSKALSNGQNFAKSTSEYYLRDIICRGLYADQLEHFLSYFDGNQLQIILYDEIVNAPLEVIKRVFNHLGVQADFRPKNINKRPKKNSYNVFLKKLERVGAGHKVISKLGDIAHQFVGKYFPGIVDLSTSFRELLLECYWPQIERTQKIIDTLPVPNRPAGIDARHLWR